MSLEKLGITLPVEDLKKVLTNRELAIEQLQFAENSMRYQSTLSFLSGKINTLMSAIKGE